jgi:uncharacterized RDD family membrane protein YckC
VDDELARSYAGASARGVAFAIDCGLVTLLCFVVAVPVSLALGPAVEINEFADSAGEALEVDRGIATFDAVLSTLVNGVYFIGSWVRRGATPGQRASALEVEAAGEGGGRVDVTVALRRWLLLGAPMGLSAAVSVAGAPGTVRALVNLTVVGWYLVLVVSTARHPEHRGVHDRLAGTVVVGQVRLVPSPPVAVAGAARRP